MGWFVSCFRSKYRERRLKLKPYSRSISDSYDDLESLGERCVVKNELEEKVCHPRNLEEKLMQEAKQLKLCGEIQETSMEICPLSKKMAFQELNGSDQSSNSAQTLSNKKIQLAAQCEQENSPDQAIMSPSGLGKGNSTSCQSTPGTGSSEEMRACKLDQTQVRNGIGVLISDSNSPNRSAMTLDGEMKMAATIYSYKETPVTGKWVNPELKSTHQVEISSVIKSVELGKENEVAGERSIRTKKCCEYTPKFVVSDLSQRLNGIPNTTTKYKEDQKVKWHATPFEERLERILSDDTMPPPRKLISGRLIQLEE